MLAKEPQTFSLAERKIDGCLKENLFFSTDLQNAKELVFEVSWESFGFKEGFSGNFLLAVYFV
jgi:hypothetical protein